MSVQTFNFQHHRIDLNSDITIYYFYEESDPTTIVFNLTVFRFRNLNPNSNDQALSLERVRQYFGHQLEYIDIYDGSQTELRLGPNPDQGLLFLTPTPARLTIADLEITAPATVQQLLIGEVYQRNEMIIPLKMKE